MKDELEGKEGKLSNGKRGKGGKKKRERGKYVMQPRK